MPLPKTRKPPAMDPKTGKPFVFQTSAPASQAPGRKTSALARQRGERTAAKAEGTTFTQKTSSMTSKPKTKRRAR